MSTIEKTVNQIGIQAKVASKELARISGAKIEGVVQASPLVYSS